MGKKRVHKPDKDAHNEKQTRENARKQRDLPEVDESMSHRSVQSGIEGGQNEQRGEPIRPGHLTPKGPRPLENQ